MVSSMSICFWQAHCRRLHRTLHREYDGKLVDLHWFGDLLGSYMRIAPMDWLWGTLVVLKNSQCFDQIFGNLHFKHLSKVQIGRASCREREKISVMDESLQISPLIWSLQCQFVFGKPIVADFIGLYIESMMENLSTSIGLVIYLGPT